MTSSQLDRELLEIRREIEQKSKDLTVANGKIKRLEDWKLDAEEHIEDLYDQLVLLKENSAK